MLGGVPRPGSAGLGELLPAVPVLVEPERMDVDLSSAFVAQHETRGQAGLDRRIVAEADLGERALGLRELIPVDREVEIRVIPRLLPDERIDAPAAVDPYRAATTLQRAQHLADVRARHVSRSSLHGTDST